MKKNILFVNSFNYNCGVFQYGKRSYDILRKSTNYNFFYIEVSNKADFDSAVNSLNPKGIIYNYHPSTLPWVYTGMFVPLQDIKHYGIHHEGEYGVVFDYNLLSDSAAPDRMCSFSLPRPLLEDKKIIDYGKPQFPVIGSFGFGFYNKGFQRLVKMVSDEFERATVRLNIPFAHYGDSDGAMAREVSDKCQKTIDRDKINLVITHDFMKDSVLLNFLASNTLNCFLYDPMPSRGLSSVIDYALSVEVPIAISDSDMFRHINSSTPIVIGPENSLKQIINRGTEPLKEYKEKWSNKNFIQKYEYVLNVTL